MIFQFYFKRMQSSDFLKTLSQRKFYDMLERFVGPAGLVHITFLQDKTEHKVQCRLHSREGNVLFASDANESIYAAIDGVAQKLEAQLSRHKMRKQARLRHLRPRALSSGWRAMQDLIEGTRGMPLPEAAPYRLLN